MSPTEELKKSFRRIVAAADHYLPYNFRWETSTGTLAHAVRDELSYGQVYVSFDTKGREIILIGTAHGNVVIHERYPAGGGRPFELVVEVPEPLQWITHDGPLTAKSLEHLAGADSDLFPIGAAISHMYPFLLNAA